MWCSLLSWYTMLSFCNKKLSIVTKCQSINADSSKKLYFGTFSCKYFSSLVIITSYDQFTMPFSEYLPLIFLYFNIFNFYLNILSITMPFSNICYSYFISIFSILISIYYQLLILLHYRNNRFWDTLSMWIDKFPNIDCNSVC